MSFYLTGFQHDSAQELATQLLNAENNKRVEILDLRGSIAQDLRGAFEEWHARSKRTKCRKYLYRLEIISYRAQGGISRAQYFGLIERVEETLGLSRQPRVVVLYAHNDGHEDCHVV
jgi:hypothetical protein